MLRDAIKSVRETERVAAADPSRNYRGQAWVPVTLLDQVNVRLDQLLDDGQLSAELHERCEAHRGSLRRLIDEYLAVQRTLQSSYSSPMMQA